MSRFPREPLDAEERALAAALPRLHGRDEPDAALDARILSAAHAAVQASPRPARRRRSWIAPIGVAASLCLAVGLAWRLRPPPALPPVPASASAPAADASASVRFVGTPEQAKPSPVLEPPQEEAPTPELLPAVHERARMVEPPAAPIPAPAAPPPEEAAAAVLDAPAPAAMAPPPPAPPPSPPAERNDSYAADAVLAREPAAAAGMVGAAQAKTAAPRRDEARRAAEATTLDSVSVDAPDDDVPPATMNGPQARDAWLKRIRELARQGKQDEARASLAEFRRRYPDAVVPRDLRALEPAAVPDPPAN